VGNNEWLDIDVLDDYLEGKLDAGMMYKVERISLEDPFVAQALAGLSESKKRAQSLSLLQKQLQERVAQKPVERKMWRITSQRLSIAATAAVLFITVSVLFWMRRENHQQKQAEIASNKAKSIEVDIKPEITAAAPVDTFLAKSKAETLINQEKVVRALDKTLHKGSGAVAMNKSTRNEALDYSVLHDKPVGAMKLKREISDSQINMSAAVPTKVPAPPVQALEGRVAGIQVQASHGSVKGVVLDGQGRPIPGANVKMAGNNMETITNMSGEFALPVGKEDEKVSLEVASIGYNKKNIEAKADQKLNIRLEENSAGLSEVVVVGYGTNRKKSITGAVSKVKQDTAFDATLSLKLPRSTVANPASPLAGWEAYNNYLKSNNGLYRNGDMLVELQFTVKEDGSPSRIKVLRSPSKEMEKEAIRLLNAGPKWIYDKSKNKGMLKITF